MPKMKRKDIKIDAKTYNKLKYIAKAQNKPLTHFLREISKELFEIMGLFEKANVVYDRYGDSLTISVYGKSNVVSGSFRESVGMSDSEVDEEIRKRAEEALDQNRMGEQN